MGSIDRRQFLKLSAGLGAAVPLSSCRTLLDRLDQLRPTPTSLPTVALQPSPTSTVTPPPTVTVQTSPASLSQPAAIPRHHGWPALNGLRVAANWRSIGLHPGEKAEAVSASSLKVPLTGHSVFSEVIEKGLFFYGESDDTMLKKLFQEIGPPLRPTILLLPMKSRQKVLAIRYGDFGVQEVSPVFVDLLVLMAHVAGLVLDNMLYRRQAAKASGRSIIPRP